MRQYVFLIVWMAAIAAGGSTSYYGSPFGLPDTVGKDVILEAENHDSGEDGHRGGKVDDQSCGPNCKYSGITSIQKDDWFVYSLQNKFGGTFDIEISLASPATDASLKVEIGNRVNIVAVPFSGEFESRRRTTIFNVPLPKGAIRLKISTSTGRFNLDYFRFIRRTIDAD